MSSWTGSARILGVEEAGESFCACSNSYIERDTRVAASSYIEDSYIYSGSSVGEHCVVSAVTLRGGEHSGSHGPARPEAKGRKLRGPRLWVNDNPKGTLEEDAAFLNGTLGSFLKNAGLTRRKVWDGEGHFLWTAKLYRSALPSRKQVQGGGGASCPGRQAMGRARLPSRQKPPQPAGKALRTPT